MTAQTLIAKAQADHFARLKWRVLCALGICPASVRARLLTKRAVLSMACQLILDSGEAPAAGSTRAENPNFDMARFQDLAGG